MRITVLLALLSLSCTDPLLYGDPAGTPPPVCHELCPAGDPGVVSTECPAASTPPLRYACRCFSNDAPLVGCQDFGFFCVAACP